MPGRRLTASGNHWRDVVQYAAETYGLDPLSVAYYLGQWQAGTREASCIVARLGRRTNYAPGENPPDASHG